MNGVVIQTKKHKAAVITENYGIITVKNKNYDIGDCIEILCDKHSSAHFSFKKFATIFSAIIFTIIASFFSYNYYDKNLTSSYVITIDINPLVEIYFNENDKVIKTVALNADAEQLDLNSLKNQNVDDALKNYIILCSNKGYLTENVIVNVTIDVIKETDFDNIAFTDSTQKIVTDELNDIGIKGSVNIIQEKSSKEKVSDDKNTKEKQ